MKDLTFKVDEDGVLVEYKILKKLEDESKNIKYLVYTNDGHDIYASRYRIIDNKLILEAIENDDEWDFVEEHVSEVLDGKTLY